MSTVTSGLQSLATMAHLLAQKHVLNDLLETAAEHACEALGAATVSVSRLVPSGDVVETLVNVGDLGGDEKRWPDDETYEIWGDRGLMSVILDRTTVVESVDDEQADERERALLRRLGKGCSLTSPIMVDGQAWGEVYVTRLVGAPVFDRDAVAYAEVLVAILAAAVSRTIRETDLQELAFHDPLTGLFNRRALDEHAAALFDLGDEPERAVVVVALDVNRLKQVNDTEGHATGDRVLRSLAAALTFTFEQIASSIVARVGGDEFTVVASGDDVVRVEEAVRTLCRDVTEKSDRIGMSAGIASVVLTPDSDLTMPDLFAAADRALYVAKRTGSVDPVIADDLGT